MAAESQRRPSSLINANNRIGDTLRQLGKPAEALPYYQKAIQQIESTRSLLESRDYRQSFFEGGLGAYLTIIETSLAWNVEDSSTAQLMASLYKNLKTMTKVEALRQAQLQLIRGNINSDLLARRGIGGVGKLGETPSAPLSAPNSNVVSTSHPYFWAPFILVGEGK